MRTLHPIMRGSLVAIATLLGAGAASAVNTVNADRYYDFETDQHFPEFCTSGNGTPADCVAAKVGCAWVSGHCEVCNGKTFANCINSNTNCVWESPGVCVNREVSAIHMTNPGANTGYPNVIADINTATNVPWTSGDADPAGAGHYWEDIRPRSKTLYSNVAFYKAPSGAIGDGLLLLYMPGCGNRPLDYTHFYLRAASYGYHVISVPYWNECDTQWSGTPNPNPYASGDHQCMQLANTDYDYRYTYSPPFVPATTNVLAAFNTNPGAIFPGDIVGNGFFNVDACISRLQRYKFSDPNLSDRQYLLWYNFLVPDDSNYGSIENIEHRVTMWLRFLRDHYGVQNGNQNWEQFLDANGNVIWGKVVIAGHSQGSTLVPEATSEKAPFRSIFFSGPAMHIGTDTPSVITNASNIGQSSWGFYGNLDGGSANDADNYATMNMPVGSIPVPFCADAYGSMQTDICCVPFCSTRPNVSNFQTSGTHRLAASQGTHNSIRGELGEPRHFVNQDAWDYMLTAKGGAGSHCTNSNWCQSGLCMTVNGLPYGYCQ